MDFFRPEGTDLESWELLISNYPAHTDPHSQLRPYEARVFYKKEAASL